MRITALFLLGLSAACIQPARLVKSDADRVLAAVTLDAPNPGVPGSYEVRRFYYGSGTDRRRPEFRDSVLVRTRSVNATPFVRGIDKNEAKKRWRYWGFTEKALPLNGRVWYPVGDGPFPIVLIVHGNHNMKEYSDPGYAYLGELFAGRGFITVSVDQNFINGAMRTENDARGWLLLKHLEAWRGMEADAAFPLRGKVDLENVALIGHSRGGEAVAVASGFNRLSHYPDDARVTFAFGFGILYSVIVPVFGSILPISPAAFPVYQMFPSLSACRPCGPEFGVGSGNSLNCCVAGSKRPTTLARWPVYQIDPSGATAGSCGYAGVLGVIQ